MDLFHNWERSRDLGDLDMCVVHRKGGSVLLGQEPWSLGQEACQIKDPVTKAYTPTPIKVKTAGKLQDRIELGTEHMMCRIRY